MRIWQFITLSVLTISFSLISGCGVGAFQIRMIPENQQLEETELKSDKGFFISDKIAIIDVDGVLYNAPQSSFLRDGDNPVSTFYEKLQKAGGDKNVKAVVLRLNSPGGSVAATDIMYHSLMKFKKNTGKPVIAAMMDTACSGAYYLACGSDGIIAQPSCVTGSIGTIMQTISVKGTMEKLGVEAVAIKSGKMKDIGSPLHELSEEEQKILQSVIDDFYGQFLDVVKKGRENVDKDRLDTLADGRIFTAEQALDEHLIDRKGYLNDGIEWAKELAGVKKCSVVIYKRPQSYKPNIYGSAMSGSSIAGALVNVEIPDWLNSSGVKFLYLWQPGM